MHLVHYKGSVSCAQRGGRVSDWGSTPSGDRRSLGIDAVSGAALIAARDADLAGLGRIGDADRYPRIVRCPLIDCCPLIDRWREPPD
ncbi:MAG: hypothetical protein AAF517_24135 [Planctomycetota bacterium]